MVQKTLYCQKCATPHDVNYPWLFWKEFRLDTLDCKDQLIKKNIDILQEENLFKAKNKKIAARLKPDKIDTSDISSLKSELDQYIFCKPKKVRSNYLRGFYSLKVSCPNCKEIIPKSANICPFCKEYTKPRYRDFEYPTKVRNNQIVALLNQGQYTLEEVGKRYGVSRQRIEQIFLKCTGKNYRLREEKVKQEKQIQQQIERIKRAIEIKFLCRGCSKPVTGLTVGRRLYYCFNCHKLVMEMGRDPSIKFICKNQACQKEFHPLRNWKSIKSQPKFCSVNCYMGLKRKITVFDIKKLLDERERKEHAFSAFYFKYQMLNNLQKQIGSQ